MCSVFEGTLVTEVIGAEEEEEEIASRKEEGGSTHSLRKSGVAMVYVNNQLVLRNATLREGDKLRVGQTHVFQLNHVSHCLYRQNQNLAGKEFRHSFCGNVGLWIL